VFYEIRYLHKGSGNHLGALVDEHVLDLSGLDIPKNMLDFIRSGEETWTLARNRVLSGDLKAIPLHTVRLWRPSRTLQRSSLSVSIIWITA
jgi:hypothetical protein